MSYCQAGDTATVTLPDGSIKSFTNTPISINFSEKYNTSNQDITIGLNSNGVFQNYFRFTANGNIVGVGALRGPAFVPIPGYVGYENIVVKTDNVSNPYQVIGWIWGYNISTFIVFSHTENAYLTPRYLFDIKDKDNNQVLYQEFDSNNYSVECVAPCPPGTLDCGDGNCCSCDFIFNEISQIRYLIRSL